MNELIKKAYPRIVTTKEIEEEVKRMNVIRMAEEHKEYKLSNAERRLRQSESPMVKAIKNERKNIVGYRYKGFVMEVKPSEPEQGQMFATEKRYY